MSETLFKLINQLKPVEDQPLLKAIARRAIWVEVGRCEILARYLTAALVAETFQTADAAELLKLVETYQPADVSELLARIPQWLEALRQEINQGGGAKPFFNERVQDLHGGGRDQRRQDNSRLTAKEAERAFLERLQRVLAT